MRRLTLLLLNGLLALVPLLAVHQEGAQRHLYEQALRKFHGNDFVNARTDFRQAYELAPRPEVLYYIGYCELNLGNYVESNSAFERKCK